MAPMLLPAIICPISLRFIYWRAIFRKRRIEKQLAALQELQRRLRRDEF
jgi:hypothetical protein